MLAGDQNILVLSSRDHPDVTAGFDYEIFVGQASRKWKNERSGCVREPCIASRRHDAGLTIFSSRNSRRSTMEKIARLSIRNGFQGQPHCANRGRLTHVNKAL
jgi:hypothetical protein